ncbi:OmpP1/FadL family transporter [Acidithiobacillus sp.]
MRHDMMLLSALAAALLSATAAKATVGYQFNGIGQYELGMSGAVVAAPGDAMTVITNPAGMAWIQAQGDAAAEIFNPTRSASFGQGTIGSHTNIYGIPALGWMVPVQHRRVFLGGGFFGTAGLGVNYLQQPYFVPSPADPSQLIPANLKAYSSISMMIMALGVAWKPSSTWSIGVALNFANENVAFQETTAGTMPNGFPFSAGMNFSNPANAYGIGATMGVLYKINTLVTLGATYRSPIFFTPLTWQETAESVPNPVTGEISAAGSAGQYSMRLNFPQQIALGIALHPTQKLLVSIEGQWINWRSTLNTVSIYGPWDQGGSIALGTHWQNSWVGSVGVQYVTTRWLTLRTGYSYGSSPITKGNLYSNLLAPAVVTNQVTVGATENLATHWQITEAYMHAFKNTMRSNISGTNIPINASLAENAFGLQVNYLF